MDVSGRMDQSIWTATCFGRGHGEPSEYIGAQAPKGFRPKEANDVPAPSKGCPKWPLFVLGACVQLNLA